MQFLSPIYKDELASMVWQWSLNGASLNFLQELSFPAQLLAECLESRTSLLARSRGRAEPEPVRRTQLLEGKVTQRTFLLLECASSGRGKYK